MLWTANDDQLVRRTLAGRPDAFYPLVRRYLPAATCVALAHTGNIARAQDIAQNAFIEAYARLDELPMVGTFGRWFIQITRKKSLADHAPGDTQPSSTALGNGSTGRLAELSGFARELLFLHYGAAEPVRECAAVLWVSTATAAETLASTVAALGGPAEAEKSTAALRDALRSQNSSGIAASVAQSGAQWKKPEAFPAVKPSQAAADWLRFRAGTRAVLAPALLVLVAAAGLGYAMRPEDTSARIAQTSREPGLAAPPMGDAPTVADQLPQPVVRDDAAPRASAAREEVNSGLGLSISGVVLDRFDRPIPGVSVRAYTNGPFDDASETDAKGRFTLTRLTTGTYNLRATREGYLSSRPSTVNAGSRDIEIVLERKPSISGRVVFKDTGKPATEFYLNVRSGFTLKLPPSREARVLENNGFQLCSDQRGRFHLPDVDVRSNMVAVIVPGYKPGYAILPTLRPQQKVDNIVVTLEPAAVITARVLDPEGRPIEGAYIFFNELSRLTGRVLRDRVGVTDLNGELTMDSQDERPQLLLAYHPDFAPAIADLGASPIERDLVLPIQLSRGARLSGQLRDENGPIPDNRFELTFVSDEAVPVRTYQATTDPLGQFVFEHLAPGNALLKAVTQPSDPNAIKPDDTAAGLAPVRMLTAPVQLNPNEDSFIDVEFKRFDGVVEGAISLDGEKPRFAYAEVAYRNDDRQYFRRAQCDENGKFRLVGLPSGTHTIYVTATFNRSLTLWSDNTVEVADDNPVTHDFKFDGGVVLQGSLGGPMGEGAVVHVVKGNINNAGAPLPVVAEFRAAQWDRDFLIAGLAPGTYSIISRRLESYRYALNSFPALRFGRAPGHTTIQVGPPRVGMQDSDSFIATEVVDADASMPQVLRLGGRRRSAAR